MLAKSLFFHVPSLCTQEHIYSVYVACFSCGCTDENIVDLGLGFMWPIYQSVVMVNVLYYMLKIFGFLHNYEKRRTSF